MLLAPITRAIIKLLGVFDRGEENDELVRYTRRDENFVLGVPRKMIPCGR